MELHGHQEEDPHLEMTISDGSQVSLPVVEKVPQESRWKNVETIFAEAASLNLTPVEE